MGRATVPLAALQGNRLASGTALVRLGALAPFGSSVVVTSSAHVAAKTAHRPWRVHHPAVLRQNDPATRLPAPLTLLVGLALAALAQLLILRGDGVAGLALYLTAGAMTAGWAARHGVSAADLVDGTRLGKRSELALVAAVILIAAGARLVHVRTFPVGIDGDELKWTAQVYHDFVARDGGGDFAGQRTWTPTSFYLGKVAFDLFGVDFGSPRVLTALLSSVATGFFYLVVRTMFNAPTALIATLFMATSYFDVNASRQAVVQSFTKLPMILAIFFVIRGVDRRVWYEFLLCGVALFVGVLTYDTFFVVPPIILAYMLFRAALGRGHRKKWLAHAALVLAPVAVAWPTLWSLIEGRREDYLKGVTEFGLGELTAANAPSRLIDNAQATFTALFQSLQGADYALDWPGPLVNPIVLVFAVLGLVLVLVRAGERHNALLIVAFLIGFFPAPIISGNFAPRVLYVGLAPIFAFAAVGLMAAVAATAAIPGSARLRKLRGVKWLPLGAVLAIVTISDLWIFSTRLINQEDWLKRRAFADAVNASVQEAPLTVLAVTKTLDDFVWFNTAALPFLTYTGAATPEAEPPYRVVAFDDLPGALSALGGGYGQVNILFDEDALRLHEEATLTLETVKRCFGGSAASSSGLAGESESPAHPGFATVVVHDRDLLNPSCYALNSVVPFAPGAESLPADGAPLHLRWTAEPDGRATAYRVVLEERNPAVAWIEAESFPLQEGWLFESKQDHYPGWSGSGYVLDAERSMPTEHRAALLEAGRYDVWVRSMREDIEGHRSYVSVGSRSFEFALSERAPLRQWNWERVGEVPLEAGEVPVVLSREYGELGWEPLLVDVVVLSRDPAFDPRLDEPWAAQVDSGEVHSAESQFVLPTGLPPGTYRWRVHLLDGDVLVDAAGSRGVWSDTVELVVR